MTLRLGGLDPATRYEVTNFDMPGTTVANGRKLMQEGLTVEIKDQPGSAVITYRVAK